MHLASTDTAYLHRARPRSREVQIGGLQGRRHRPLQVALDLIGLTLAWHACKELHGALIASQIMASPLPVEVPPLYWVLVMWITTILYSGSQKSDARPKEIVDVRSVGESTGVASVLLVAGSFLSSHATDMATASFISLFPFVTFLSIVGARYVATASLAALDEKCPAPERVAVVGALRDACKVITQLRTVENSLVTPVGVVLPCGVSGNGLEKLNPVLGTTAELGTLINRHDLQRLILVNGNGSGEELDHCTRIAKRMGVVPSWVLPQPPPDTEVKPRWLYGLNLLELKPLRSAREPRLSKRVFDVIGSSALFLIISPLFLFTAALVKLTSAGPVFYRATRAGRGGRHFMFLKFRSMYDGRTGREIVERQNEKSGHIFKVRSDPRVTPLGRLLRRYSLDELPQLINVLRGDMSLVGPRPLPAEDLDPDGQSKEFATWSEERSRMLPGITGLWQINGRSDLPFSKMVDYDLLYVRNWSMVLDLRILLRTPLAAASGQGAY